MNPRATEQLFILKNILISLYQRISNILCQNIPLIFQFINNPYQRKIRSFNKLAFTRGHVRHVGLPVSQFEPRCVDFFCEGLCL